MYRRYIIVGIVFFLLIWAYFMFFDKKEDNNEYENYYNKLVSNENFISYIDDVNISVEEIDEGNNKYSYIITFDGVNQTKENIKILVLNQECRKDQIEEFPSFGIIANEGYSLVKLGNEDESKKMIKGVNLAVLDKEKIEYFIIYFSHSNLEQFVKIKVSDFIN